MITAKIDLNEEAEELAYVIRESFKTVAEDFNITPENAPTNPAYLTKEDLLKSASDKGIKYYGFYKHGTIIGCYALEKALQGTYYLERLAVIPGERHKGTGRKLVHDSMQRVKESGGNKVSIAIIDEHRVLKDWYKRLGFQETGKKNFPHLPFNVCFLEYRL